MGILGIVWRNFGRGARTRRPDDMPATPSPFRGLIEQDASLCTGCRACADGLLAQSDLVQRRSSEIGITWNFFAGQCSFCGLCVQYCPTHAISNHGKLPPVTGDQSQLRVAHEILLSALHGLRPADHSDTRGGARSDLWRAAHRLRIRAAGLVRGVPAQGGQPAHSRRVLEAERRDMEEPEGDMQRADLVARLAAIPGSRAGRTARRRTVDIGTAPRRRGDGARNDRRWAAA